MTAAAAGPDRGRAIVRAGIACALLLGVLIRTWLVYSHDFPLNDGGLFWVMVRDLQRAHYHLPLYSTYNGMAIPYAYSPLAFYAAALVDDLTPLGLTAVFQLLPLVVSCCAMLAFVALARTIIGRRPGSGVLLVAAAFAYAVVPRSFIWTLMGGGLTRSFGVLFAILTLREMYLLFETRILRHALLAGVFAALTLTSHLGTAPFVAFSSALFLLACGRHRQGLTGSIVAGVVAALLSAPWWLTVAARHGIAPFLAAQATGESVFTSGIVRHRVVHSLAAFASGTTGEPLFPVILVLALAGAVYVVPRGRLLLPVWWIATLVLDTRAGPTYAAIPVALLAGIGIGRVLLPVLWQPAPEAATTAGRGARRSRWAAIAALGFLVCYAAGGAVLTDPDVAGEGRVLISVTGDQREAIAWASAHTAPNARFLIIPDALWYADAIGEWFPALANRRSVATPQGYEWMPGKVFTPLANAHDALLGCRQRGVDCLEEWSRTNDASYEYVFVPRGSGAACCTTLVAALDSSPRYVPVRRMPGGDVFQVRTEAVSSRGTEPPPTRPPDHE